MRGTDGLPFLLEEGMEVAFVPPQIDCPRSAQVRSVRPAKDGAFLVSFDTVQDRGTAQGLVGCSCLAKRDALPPDFDAVHKRPLEGFQVVDRALGPLGTVDEVLDNPGQRLISVTRTEGLLTEGEGPLLIPWVDEFVKEVDEEAAQVSVEVPASLLDLARPSAGHGASAREDEGGGLRHDHED